MGQCAIEQTDEFCKAAAASIVRCGTGNDTPAAAPAGEPTITADDAEILRLRDKVHGLEKTVWLAGERAKEFARRLEEVRHDLGVLEERVDNMTEADKIAGAVTAAIRSDRRARWTLPRIITGAVLSAVLAVPAAHELVVWVSG